MTTEIANAYIALYTKMPGVKNDIAKALGGSDAQSAVKSSGASWGGLLMGAVGGAVALGAGKLISAVTGAVDGAIKRVDTMNNFPKIMRNFGYSADDASASIKSMSDRLQGLPTSLDTMAGAVQQLAPLTSSLGEATELSLAFNNALLAGGKSTALQANALDQYVQMLSVGKVDMAAWRSIVSAMPGQMNQLAQSLLGASAGQMDLYNAMQDGTVSFDQFNAAVMDLNKNGTNGFASFEKQARDSTDGIATAQANLSTAITRNLATVIEKLRPQIMAAASAMTGLVNAMGPLVVQVVEAGSAFLGWASVNMDWLIPLGIALGVVAAGLLAVNVAATVAAAGGLAKWVLATKAGAAAQAAFNVVMNANPIMLVITAIAALVAGLVYFFTQTELGREVWANVTAAIGAAFTWLWESVISPVVDFIVTAWGELMSFFNDAWTNVLQPIFAAIGAVFTWVYENVILPVVTAIMLYIGLWAALVQFVWENVIQPAMTAIGALFTWLWVNAVQPAVNFINLALQGFGIAVQWLNSNIIQPVFAAIGAIFGWIYNSIVVPIVNGVIAYFQMLGAIFTWLYSNVVQPVFNAVGAAFNWIWGSIIRPVINFINSAINNVGSTIRAVFGGIASFVGSAFQAVLGVVRGPINALINLINGIIGGLNSIKVNIPSWVPIVGGQTFGLNIPKIPRLAEGGLIPRSPGGTLAVVGEGRYDEVVMPLSPEVLRELRGDQQGGIRPGDRVVFEVEGQPLTAVAKRVVRSAFPTAQSVTSEFAR